MARPISDEELQLKRRARRRLVGAIVLVSAVAVILPMVLDSEPQSVNKNVDIQIPPSDSAEFKPKAAPPVPNLVEGSGAAAPATVGSAPDTSPAPPEADTSASSKLDAPGAKAGMSDSAKSAPSASSLAGSEHVTANTERATEPAKPDLSQAKQKVVDHSEDRTTPAKEAKASAKDPSAPANAYIVQVAALSDAARVKQLRKQIAGAGVKTYVEVVSTKSGEVMRVRAGPYSTREAAEKARTQLKKVGLDGKVVPK